MTRVRSSLDPRYTGTVIRYENDEFVCVLWDDGRNMLHRTAEIEPERKED